VTDPRPNKHPGVGPMIPCACGCGLMIQEFDKDGRQRKYVNGHNVRALWRRLRESGAVPVQP